MTIRKATLADIPEMVKIFAIARKFMAETGNPHQWAESYPSVEQLTDDINSGDSYVCMEDERLVAFVLRGGEDPTYRVIYDGAWRNDHPLRQTAKRTEMIDLDAPKKHCKFCMHGGSSLPV